MGYSDDFLSLRYIGQVPTALTALIAVITLNNFVGTSFPSGSVAHSKGPANHAFEKKFRLRRVANTVSQNIYRVCEGQLGIIK